MGNDGAIDGASRRLNIIEASAFFYLLAPVAVFFFAFVRLEIAVPATLFLVWLLGRVAWRTDWHVSRPPLAPTIAAIATAVVLVVLAGAAGWLAPTSDWNKHYAVLNFLSSRSWPPVEMTVDGEVESLRYALGWYLVPALATKLLGLHGSNLAAAGWSALGLVIVFGLLFRSIEPRPLRCLAPILFVLFSGADLIGTYWTGFRSSPLHIEWWSGWVEFSSNMTSMLWTPQHAIPAWIAVALLLGQLRRPSAMDLMGALLFALLLWSPFTAIGLVPIGLGFAWQTRSLRIVFNRASIAAAVLIGVPLGLYLTAGSGDIPHGFIWNTPCVINRTLPDAPCFVPSSYVLFVLLELVPYFLVAFLFVPSWRRVTLLAGVFALALPLYRFGEWNDLAMRGSVPALALFAIAAAKIVAEARPALVVLVLVVVGLGVPTAAIEMNAAMVRSYRPAERATFANIGTFERYRNQYFTSEPARILRRSDDLDVAEDEVRCRPVFDLTANGSVASALVTGMGGPEEPGRWTTGKVASFACRASGMQTVRSVTLEAAAFAAPDRPLRVLFRVGDGDVVERVFVDGAANSIVLPAPSDRSDVFRLSIEIPGVRSPKELGLGADTRRLGLLIRTIELR